MQIKLQRSPHRDYIYGTQPVLSALVSKRREFYNLLIKKELNGPQIQTISSLFISHTKIRPKLIDNNTIFDQLLGSKKLHQGLVLEASPLNFELIDYLPPPTNNNSLWVALDEIQDPQNFGAILRSCHYFGIDGIVTPGKKSAPLSPAVSKTSSGAMELLTLHEAINFKRFLKESKANGWQLVGTSSSPKYECVPIHKINSKVPSLLILGNEGTGISDTILRLCNIVARIPSINPMETSVVDSLNVSVATGILLYELTKAKREL